MCIKTKQSSTEKINLHNHSHYRTLDWAEFHSCFLRMSKWGIPYFSWVDRNELFGWKTRGSLWRMGSRHRNHVEGHDEGDESHIRANRRIATHIVQVGWTSYTRDWSNSKKNTFWQINSKSLQNSSSWSWYLENGNMTWMDEYFFCWMESRIIFKDIGVEITRKWSNPIVEYILCSFHCSQGPPPK